MDPVSAIGLASSVVQLLTFAGGLISKSREIHRSTQGSLVEHDELAAIGRTLESQSRQIASQLSSYGSSSPTERQILELCDGVGELSRELIAVIEGLRAGYTSGKWASFRQALKSVLKEQEISDIMGRLERYRQQVDSLLLTSLQERLQAFTETSENRNAKIEQNYSKMMDSIESGNQWQADLIKAARRDLQDETTTKAVHIDFSASLSAGAQYERDEYSKRRLLRSLAFPDLKDRYDGIAVAHRRTFDWIFHENELPEEDGLNNFSTWLVSNKPLYWITGKPGSGKSTLMKYLSADERLQRRLNVWGAGKPLCTGRFFFWNSGTPLQMSKVGLLRSLLYQILSNYPDLIPRIFPDRWEHQELFGYYDRVWSWLELSNGFLTMISDESKMFFFVIDGLDEFEDVISNKSNVKLCVSSRPWLVFEDTFRSRPSLRMEDLTIRDIRQFAYDRLRENVMFLRLQELFQDQADMLVEQVTQKASGVFLWVVLVVKSLLEGLQDGDTIADLQARLLLLPGDLGELFEKILRELQPAYLEQASRILQAVRASYLPWREMSMQTEELMQPENDENNHGRRDGASPLRLLSLSFIEENTKSAFLDASTSEMIPSEQNFRAEQTRRRLQSRCKGLLEVPTYKKHGPNARIHFLHRTVKDFLEENRGRYFLTSTSQLFDPHISLCASFLRHAKTLNLGEGDYKNVNCLSDLMEQFLMQCHWLEREHNPKYVPFLDEMDRFAGAAFPFMHWTCLVDSYVGRACKVDSILGYAVTRSLNGYLQAKVEDGLAEVALQNRRWSLMLQT
ncbi:hypothetical protein F5Y19DRAFT_463797 [Xylariaceae sp. FL1651]|nr:hypothetical protein F5Y19DRAFT_463797 [Xylariaceae sp. FL1651]